MRIILLSLAILGTSWGFLLLLYVFVQISRAVVVSVLYPLLSHFGYGMDVKEATVLVWSGLRGAVALSLSLSVKVCDFLAPMPSTLTRLLLPLLHFGLHVFLGSPPYIFLRYLLKPFF
jgi:NhaP-type Na+/H+ or K+/H+ antiporter